MTEFKREERYIVIKRKNLSEKEEFAIRALLEGLDVGTVECVVVESDWPENEVVWKMIESRVTGQTNHIEDVRAMVEDPYSCDNCGNRGKINGSSQETFCEVCSHQRYMPDNWSPK